MSTTTLTRPEAPANAAIGVAALTAVGATVMGVAWAVVAAAVAVPVLVWIWARPPRGVFVLVALMPFDGLLLLVEHPAAAAAWKEALLGFMLLAAIAGGGRPRPASAPLWAFPLAGLATIALVSAAFVAPLQAAVGLKIMFTAVLVAVVVWWCPLDDRERDQLVTILAVVAAIVAAIGLAQQVVGHARLYELGYAYNSTIRFSGGFLRSFSTFNQPFPYAFFLMVTALVTAAVALDEPLRTRNALILLAMPLYVAGLAVSFVRAAWIGLAAGFVYLAFARHRTLLRAAPLVVAALAIAFVLGAGGFFASESLQARFDRWQGLPTVTAAAPFGQGVGSAGAAAARVESLGGGDPTFDTERVRATQVVYQPDNHYLKVLFELGIPGLVAFGALLLGVAASARSMESHPRLGAFAAGTTAVVVAASVASLASTFFEIFPADYLFWLVAGVGAVGRPLTLPTRPREARP